LTDLQACDRALGVVAMNRTRYSGAAFFSLLFVGAALLIACDPRRDDQPVLPPSRSAAPMSVSATATMNSGSVGWGAPKGIVLARAETPRPAPRGSMGGRPVSAADVDFVSNAASTGALEVEAGRVAVERAKTPAVRSFAQKLVDEHSRTSAELQALRIASTVANVASMSPKEGEQLRRLKELQGREFDREYVAQLGVAAHERAVGAFEKAAESASDTQVKSFAQAKLPALRENLKTAQALAKNLGAPVTSSKSESTATSSSK
jgi:putative membrane protein